MQYHEHEIRVRYADTDQMGVSYYANYLAWFEAARTEYLRTLGLSYREIEAEKILLPAAEAYCKYISPARYDDLLLVKSCISKLAGVRLVFEYEVRRKSEMALLAKGYTVHASCGPDFKPVRFPERLRALIEVVEKPFAPI